MTTRAATCVLALLLALAVLGCDSRRPAPLAMLDLFTFRQTTPAVLTNIEGLEHDEKGAWRWLLGPEGRVAFASDAARPYTLRFRLMNPLPDQLVTVSLNGRVLATYGPLPRVGWLEPSVAAALTFQARPGENVLAFAVSDWNGRTMAHMPTDARPLAAVFLDFLLYAR
ncbi:hypothetical protein [Solidesulfovibrio magneticus]|uniref:Lipoprotein n=1 Tax=Solidesulfovibrio magneticus (strain ATCC 700980 / DSM 13731 / RS-1) TaxID=573370 RepID=C4XHG6_SOLM1|nr:hypothetical protein [Solidesulfovibrio magneticus]BAH73934.1 hypothetical protein DMR_04430 [Solidesulfovibrio magneticus RS-1]